MELVPRAKSTQAFLMTILSRARAALPLVATLTFRTTTAAASEPCPGTWTERPQSGPAPRAAHGMAYDTARMQTVVFGGTGDIFGTTNLGDTWAWDGTAWTRLSRSGEGPQPRRDGFLAYDSARRRIVLFGGSDTELISGNRYFPETWEWDGSAWAIRARTGPPGRTGHALAFDSRRSRVVLFGGDADHEFRPADVWEWDGASWAVAATSGPRPSPRIGAALAYDSRRGRTVLYGGSGFGGVLSDTWEWDGTLWTRRDIAAPLPQDRAGAALAFDSARGVVVLFGGADSAENPIPGVWELDDTGWSRRETAGPSPRIGPAMAYDEARSRLVAFGGITRMLGAFGDTWERTVRTAPERLVPVVLDAYGRNDSHFTTELSLTNRGPRPAALTLRYSASLGTGSGTVTERLDPGRQLVIPDALAYLRGKGLGIPDAASQQQAGALLVTFGCETSPKDVAITARTTSATKAPLPIGSAGLAYTGVDPLANDVSSLSVFGLRADAQDRANVAVFNRSASPIAVRITAVSGAGDGKRAVLENSRPLGPYEWAQVPFSASGVTNGWAVVERVQGTGSFGAYGVLNDNVTNDGSFVTPTSTLPEASGAATEPGALQLPVLVETTFFASELVLANAAETPATFTLNYVESLAGPARGRVALRLAPGEQRIVPGAIDFLRQNGIALGIAGETRRAGSVRIDVEGAPLSQVYAGARTASPTPVGGQFGLFMPAGRLTPTPVAESFIYGLRADATSRSNVAVVNAGPPNTSAIRIALDVFDGDDDGRMKGTSSLNLEPGAWAQVDGILATANVQNGWVRVRLVSGTSPWLAYGVINDGGAPGTRTGDGAYIAAIP